jgi:hypothetical protein
VSPSTLWYYSPATHEDTDFDQHFSNHDTLYKQTKGLKHDAGGRFDTRLLLMCTRCKRPCSAGIQHLLEPDDSDVK